MTVEFISYVAVRYGETVVQLPPPNRHHNIMQVACQLLPGSHPHPTEDQGFVTNKGRFVGRVEAAEVALASGQITELNWAPNLYSEDVW